MKPPPCTFCAAPSTGGRNLLKEIEPQDGWARFKVVKTVHNCDTHKFTTIQPPASPAQQGEEE